MNNQKTIGSLFKIQRVGGVWAGGRSLNWEDVLLKGPLFENRSWHSKQKSMIEKEAVKIQYQYSFSNRETYPADCRKIAAVDSNKHDWDWKKRYWKKKIFVQKQF